VALFLSSLFLARLAADCESGPSWEIPPGVATDMTLHGSAALAAFIAGVAATARGWRWHAAAGRRWARWVGGCWIAALSAAFVLVVGNGGFHDAFRIPAGSPLRGIGLPLWLAAAALALLVASWLGTRGRRPPPGGDLEQRGL
jgi:hypothetical protein